MLDRYITEVNPMKNAIDIKQAAHELIDQLPTGATWEQAVYSLQVRQDVEAGLADSEAERVMTSSELRRSMGINQE